MKVQKRRAWYEGETVWLSKICHLHAIPFRSSYPPQSVNPHLGKDSLRSEHRKCWQLSLRRNGPIFADGGFMAVATADSVPIWKDESPLRPQ